MSPPSLAFREWSVPELRDDEVGWLFLDLNSYFASVEQEDQPALRGKPIIVVPVESDHTCAIAASYEAKAFGISTGTLVHEAKKRCPQVQLILASHRKYTQYHDRIVEELDRHLPIHSILSIDEMACPLPPEARVPEQAMALAQRIKQSIRTQVGSMLRCSIGLAPNRYLAKVATDMQKPDGLVVIRRCDLPDRIADLPIRALPGIGAKMEERLRRFGFRRVLQLYQSPMASLHQIWGSIEGERLWLRLHGQEVPDPAGKNHTVGHSQVLDPSFRAPDQARIIAQKLLLKAVSRMRRMGYGTSCMSLSLRIERGDRCATHDRFALAWDHFTLSHILDRLWKTLLPHVLQSPSRRLLKVSIQLQELHPMSHQLPLDLFGGPEHPSKQQLQRYERLSKALDWVNQIHGKDSLALGFLPDQVRGQTHTKIAFTRIPDAEEFKD